MVTIALLHPGAMGAAVGAALRRCGAHVCWVPGGRSDATRARAEDARLTPAGSLAEGLGSADAVLSVCPPHAALDVAREVAALGFAGTYVDANAIAPATAAQVAESLASAGAEYVDGSLIGPPPVEPGTTRLYLSGEKAEAVRAWFPDGPLEAIVLGSDPTAASALKICYAGAGKAIIALLLVIRAAAERLEVDDALIGEWRISKPDLVPRFEGAVGAVPKAWRFEGEMLEIAASLEALGLPGGFHRAAAETYAALGGLRADEPSWPAVAAALGALGGQGAA